MFSSCKIQKTPLLHSVHKTGYTTGMLTFILTWSQTRISLVLQKKKITLEMTTGGTPYSNFYVELKAF